MAARRVPRLAVQARDPTACFLDDQRPGAGVPGVQLRFPEAVHTAGCNVTEVNRRRAEAADRPGAGDERAEHPHIGLGVLLHVVGEAGDEQGVEDLGRRGYLERLAVQPDEQHD